MTLPPPFIPRCGGVERFLMPSLAVEAMARGAEPKVKRSTIPCSSATASHHELLLPLGPKDPLVHHVALPPQQQVQSPVAKAPARVRQGPQPFA